MPRSRWKPAAEISGSTRPTEWLRSLRFARQFHPRPTVLLRFHQETEPTITLLPFFQGRHRLVCLEGVRERIDRRQDFAARHFQLAAILPGGREIRIEFRRALDVVERFLGAAKFRQ